MSSIPQTTVGGPVTLAGRGIHSGRACSMKILPAPADFGIRFQRSDMPNTPEIRASIESVGVEPLLRQTILRAPERADVCVQTVEHVLAALNAMGIDNARIEMTGPEAPIWDGGAGPAAEGLAKAGVETLAGSVRRFYRIVRPLAFFPEGAADVEYTAWPSEHLTVTYFMQYDLPSIGSQAASFEVTADCFLREIAPARTFCTFAELEFLRSKGLIRGGDTDNAIVFGADGPMNTKLRWENEPARHKALDLLGDLALLGLPLQGHILVSRGGHHTNAQFVQYLRKELTPS